MSGKHGPRASLPHGSRESSGTRSLAAIVALASLAPLVIATFLTPSPLGHGTHAQLGMPPCGWAMYFGKPCATCGMTTAFAHAVRLDFFAAASSQPFGLLLTVLCGVVFWAGVHSAVTGSAVLGLLVRGLTRPPALWTLGLLFGLAWVYTWVTWPGA